ncbi:hypothetical protein Moror_211 [Moniliophthora roreri MCA 2997]|uniref:Uncharacterized protein n=1 Tax=Moniliophthora roreri (strain MCA 2997) TaxID=1381753 RepID=V2Y022_MONRO|nr:hypothetical protein Moror_211 [Moniliophthora roreri MCA 2997]
MYAHPPEELLSTSDKFMCMQSEISHTLPQAHSPTSCSSSFPVLHSIAPLLLLQHPILTNLSLYHSCKSTSSSSERVIANYYCSDPTRWMRCRSSELGIPNAALWLPLPKAILKHLISGIPKKGSSPERRLSVLLKMSSLTMSRPSVSSPLAESAQGGAARRMLPKRNSSFPSSQALRPFPTVSAAFRPQNKDKKPIKIIEPPANHRNTFVLDLSQAEFSRQD